MSVSNECSEILNQLNLGIAVVDSDYKIVFWNQWLVSHSGFDEKMVVGQSLLEVYPKLKGTRLQQAIQASTKQKLPSVLSRVFNPSPLPLYDKSNHRIKQSITVKPFSNCPNCSVIQIIDVTSSVAREKALEKQVIERRNAEQAKSAFLANMSHEIRTPLNGIIGMLELLQGEELPTKLIQYLNIATNSADALLFIINDILDFSKIEAGKVDISPVEFEILPFFQEVISGFAVNAHKKGIELIFDASQLNNTTVVADKQRLRQIVSNLISNAIKFTEKGEVVIEAYIQRISHQHFQLVCKILDTGIGIEPHIITKLFEPFQQSDCSISRRFCGTGLGLAIAKQLCHLMGGDISLSSRVGEGSCFEFDVLLHIDEQIPAVKLLLKKSCLIAEANQSSNAILAKQLKAWGARVRQISDAKNVINVISKPTDYDYVFLTSDIFIQVENELKAWQKKHVTQLVIMQQDWQTLPSSALYWQIIKPIYKSDIQALTQDTLPPHLESHEDTQKNPIQSRALSSEHIVLVVEDNPINQIVAKECLKRLGYQFSIVDNGERALDYLKEPQHSVDLILMDCQMPVMDGFTCTSKIRAGECGEVYQAIPILALTANVIESERDRCLNHGMNDFLSKPINLELLAVMLHKWLDKR